MSVFRQVVKQFLRPGIKALGGEAIRYHSATTGLVYEVIATRAASQAESDNRDGFVVTRQMMDFIVDVADLPVAPQYLDRIEWDEFNNGTYSWFQVLNLSGERSVEPGNLESETWLLHCKRIPPEETGQELYGTKDGEAYGTPDDDVYVPPRF